jgi:multidrug resistance efflux pump
MNKKMAIGALGVLLLAVLAGWLWYRHSASLEQGAMTLLGNVDIRQVSLAFQDSERIQAMRVDEGAKVKAGEVLAKLDTRTLELQAAQARTETLALVGAGPRRRRQDHAAAHDGRPAEARCRASCVLGIDVAAIRRRCRTASATCRSASVCTKT